MIQLYLLIGFSVSVLASYFILPYYDFVLGLVSTTLLFLIRGIIRSYIVGTTQYNQKFLLGEGGMMAMLWGIVYYLTKVSVLYTTNSLKEYESNTALYTRSLIGTLMFGLYFCFAYIILAQSVADPTEITVNLIGFFLWFQLSYTITDFFTGTKRRD